ncbi:MAG: stage V sporulation protein D, partial [Clostridia bacterium]|nr:stage V sporulation protein D [Clostridia bacterium]
MSKITNSNLGKRLLAIFLLIAFIFAAIIIRLAYLQIFASSNITNRALSQWTRDLPMMATRGDITDRNGIVVADTKTAYTLYVRPNSIDNVKAVAGAISVALGKDYNTIYNKINKKGVSEITVAKKLTKEQMMTISSQNFSGVYFSEESVRYFPYGDFMSQILGFTNVDGEGQFGVEKSYDKYLKGVNGQILTQTDLVGKELPNNVTGYLPSIDGMTVSLTIDFNIQSFAEKIVKDAVVDFNAKGANCLVMNPKTGEILAMAQAPTFDLNNIPRDNLNELFSMAKNSMLSNVYEPGSTFKILTTAIGLEENTYPDSHRFYCNGSRIVDGKRIKCWRSIGHGSQTFAEGVCNSCNCVFMDIATKTGTKTMYDYLRKFGVNAKTGVDLVGEGRGIMLDEKIVKNVDLARIGFGQAVAVTPIGLCAAVSSCINGGKKITPYILNNITDNNFGIVQSNSPMIGNRVISNATSERVKEMLYGVVEQGSGKYAYIPGYKIGGKTGTAQKYENGVIARGKYVSSFLGFTSVGNDDYLCLMTVDEPQGYIYYGSLVAGPYVGELFANIFNYKGYKPQYSEEDMKVLGKVTPMPSLLDMSV